MRTRAQGTLCVARRSRDHHPGHGRPPRVTDCALARPGRRSRGTVASPPRSWGGRPHDRGPLRCSGCQGVQVSGTGAVRVRRIPLRQRMVYGTIPVQVVTYRLSLLAGGKGGVNDGVTLVTPWLSKATLEATTIWYDHAPRTPHVRACHGGTVPLTRAERCCCEGSVCTMPFMVSLALPLP